MTALRERLQHAQAAYVVAALAAYLALALFGYRVVPNPLALFAAILAYVMAAAVGWWWIASVDGHRPDERVRAIYFSTGGMACWVFMAGVLVIVGWRIAHGALDAPILIWLAACTVLWVGMAAIRSARS